MKSVWQAPNPVSKSVVLCAGSAYGRMHRMLKLCECGHTRDWVGWGLRIRAHEVIIVLHTVGAHKHKQRTRRQDYFWLYR